MEYTKGPLWARKDLREPSWNVYAARLIAQAPTMADLLNQVFDYLHAQPENAHIINLKMAICDCLQKTGSWEAPSEHNRNHEENTHEQG